MPTITEPSGSTTYTTSTTVHTISAAHRDGQSGALRVGESVAVTVTESTDKATCWQKIQNFGAVKTALGWSTPAKVAYVATAALVLIVSLIYLPVAGALLLTGLFIVGVPIIFWIATSNSKEAGDAAKCCKVSADCATFFSNMLHIFYLCTDKKDKKNNSMAPS